MRTTHPSARSRDLARSSARFDARLRELEAVAKRATAGLTEASSRAEVEAAARAVDRLSEAVDIAKRLRALAEGA